ncbi:glycosyltransferase family 4 protein [Arthrobacter sp. zg-Y750]|uniref:glycosyltransferase family 4 protein n=1 Tax=Arthrobacter sp. zg-Y750 TaxID=2894189 RepID=UPI002F3EBD6B|nr:glycosyltransferase family 4 protein [Arthrobacter sp. zg-Y750]
MPERQHHIAFIVNNYPPKVGGLEQHVFALAKSLVKLGVKVTVVALGRDIGDWDDDGLNVVRLRATPMVAGVISWPLPGTTMRLTRYLRSIGVTHVSTHTRFFPMSVVGVRAARRLKVPSIHTEHGSDYVRGVSPLVGMASNTVDRTLGRYVLRTATKVLAISESAQAFVQQLSGRRAAVFHNAIDVAAFTGVEPELPAEKLVFLGRIVPGKGWERALAVASKVLPERPGASMHFIGDGAERASLEAAIAPLPFRDRIHVHGYLRSPEICRILSGAILLNPTRLAEGFQTTLLEAVAAGAAVVSTPVTAAKYLAERAPSVVVVDDDDDAPWIRATGRLLADGWAPAPAEFIASFDWAERGLEYLAVLDEQ